MTKSEWYQANKDLCIQRSKAWRENNPERYKTIQREWARRHRKRQRSPIQSVPAVIQEIPFNGPCGICADPLGRYPDFTSLHIFRGLLCAKCLTIIEACKGNQKYLRWAIQYLDKFDNG